MSADPVSLRCASAPVPASGSPAGVVESPGPAVPERVAARDPRHNAAYRAVLDYCSHGVVGIGPFEAEEIVRLVERAFSAPSAP